MDIAEEREFRRGKLPEILQTQDLRVGLLEIQRLDSILFFFIFIFIFLFFLVYSIFRTRVRDQWDVTGHGHTVTWSCVMIKMVEGSGRNDIILYIIYIVVLR